MMNLRKQRQRIKERDALNDERLFEKVYNYSDPTARVAIHHMTKFTTDQK